MIKMNNTTSSYVQNFIIGALMVAFFSYLLIQWIGITSGLKMVDATFAHHAINVFLLSGFGGGMFLIVKE